jgi:hypothetical protein
VLYYAVSAGATVAALTTGWLRHVRRLGLVVIWAVVAWGAAIAAAGIVGALVLRRSCLRWPAPPTRSVRCVARPSIRASPPITDGEGCPPSTRWL